MYKDEIDKIRSRLPALLASQLNKKNSTDYQLLWSSRVNSLLENGSDKKEFFRNTLMMTIKLNRRFKIDSTSGNQIRKMILSAFVGDDSVMPENALRPYVELNSSLSELDSDEAPSAKHIVFNAILTELADVFDTRFDAAGAMKAELVRNLASLSVPIRTKSLLEKWAKNRCSPGCFNEVKENELRLAIDLVYAIYCDQWGPSVTDRLMSQALERVEAIPEAKKFPPQRVL